MQANLRIEPPTNWEERALELQEQVDDLQRENTEQRDIIARLTGALNDAGITLGEPGEMGPRG